MCECFVCLILSSLGWMRVCWFVRVFASVVALSLCVMVGWCILCVYLCVVVFVASFVSFVIACWYVCGVCVVCLCCWLVCLFVRLLVYVGAFACFVCLRD